MLRIIRHLLHMTQWGVLLAGSMPLIALTACATHDGPPLHPVDLSQVKNARPHWEPLSHYGNPSHYEVNGYRYYVSRSSKGYDRLGLASWYGRKFQGKLTSMREPYNMYAMTAASRVLPLPTYVLVTNLDNGRRVIVRVNDRGPFGNGRHRIIDLSYAAAVKLGYAKQGLARVRVTALTMKRKTTLAKTADKTLLAKR